MSKVTDAKNHQGYTPTPKNCKTCTNRTFDRELPKWALGDPYYDCDERREKFLIETNQRCKLGGFAVKMTAVCDFWKGRENASAD